MRKCRKPSQEDPAAVGPSQEQEYEPVKGNPSPSAMRCLLLQGMTMDTMHRAVTFSKILKFKNI